MTSEAAGPDAPGDEGLMLVEAWPTGAAYTWETRGRRMCWTTASETGFSERACTTHPVAVGASRSVEPLTVLFTDGWVSLFTADHHVVTSATCNGEPLKVQRVGTLADGARTLYSVWFPDYTKGSIGLSLSHDGITSEDTFLLSDIGDRTCTAAPRGPHPTSPAG